MKTDTPQDLFNDLANTLENVLLSYRNGISAMGPEDLRQRMALVDKAKKETPMTLFHGPQPSAPEFHHTPNGVFLRMDDDALQALAIMARCYLEVVRQDMWEAFPVPAAHRYLHPSRELAEQIADAV